MKILKLLSPFFFAFITLFFIMRVGNIPFEFGLILIVKGFFMAFGAILAVLMFGCIATLIKDFKMNRLNRLKNLPCVGCHAPPPSDPCHANWGEFGKGMGKKSDDEYTIPLCRRCHQELDTYAGRNRQQAKAWFLSKWDFVNKVLDEQERPTQPMF